MGIRIRPARPDEADLLTEIACAAKAHWGYTAAQVLADITALRILSIAGLFWLALAVPPDPAVGVPVDSALFVALDFWSVLLTEVMVGLFISNILYKFAVTFVSIPGITLVKEQRPHLKQDSLN